MAGGEKCESLFSLEVVVESVDNICISCYKPAIAFRLLDFPTVVIRSERQGLLAKETSHQIQSGKSCLFKMSKDVLCERLKNTPLYIMLVDTCSANTKLLASTTISLLNCFQNILASIDNSGVDIPAVSGGKGEFVVYNLMGSQVATLKLGFRIFSFGLSMSGHVNLSLPKRLQQTETVVTEMSPKKPENLKASGQLEPPLLQHRVENRSTSHKELVNPDRAKENYIPLADAHTQTEQIRKHSLTLPQKYENDNPRSYSPHHYSNISRPPPLYYNSMSTSITPQIQAVSSEQKHFDNDLTKPRLMSASLEKPLKDSNVKIDSQLQYCDASIQTCEMSRTTQRHNILASHVDGHQMSLPLIEALLNELSLVRSKYASNDLPQQGNEGTASQCKNRTVVNIQEKGHVYLNKQQDKQTKTKKGVLRGPKKSLPTKTNSKGVLISRHPVKFKKSSLKYGTTKTQKLREAFSKRNTYDKHDVRPEAGKDEHFLSEQNDEKRQVDNLQIASVVGQKSKLDLKDKKSSVTHDNELECKDIGIQVRISDDKFPGSVLKHHSEDSPLTGDGSNNAILGATYINNVVPFIASNQVDDNTDELSGSNFSTAKELKGPLSKPKLPSNYRYPDKLPAFSNVSPTVPVARNTRFSNNEESSEASQKKSRSLDSTLLDQSLELVSRPVGKMQSNSNRSSRMEVQKKRSSSSEKSVGEVHSKSDWSGDHDLPGKPISSWGKISDDRQGLVNKSIDEAHSYCGISLQESTRDKPVSLGSRLSSESLSSVCKSVGEDRSNRKRSSKESMQDKSISSDSRLSDKSLDLVSKPVDQLLSMSGYSDDFESDASDDKNGSLAS